ncbi:MAG: GNAT family N-acetyltransferase [Symbiopectobacterium sp.]|uniref:GNAT family N-acetyltransferase n=1 Tax=Symbiopectobacterium sp. TaxID=2952789 RepID=UPI0039E8D6EB
MEIIRVTEPWHLAAVHYLRIQIALSLDIPISGEIDEKPGDECDYLLIVEGETPVATGRLRHYQGQAKFEQISVAVEYQGQGIGSLLIREMEVWAAEQGFTQVLITSKWDVRQFYLQLSYQTEGDIIEGGMFALIRVTKTLG